jgi:DNA-binding NtrC family response regulator
LSVLTHTLPAEPTSDAPARRADHLYLALDASRPRFGARWSLADVNVVELGRGAAPGVKRTGKTLRLEFADRWMSTNHLRLERSRAHWLATDAGSRNGFSVNGRRQATAILLDGDVVELGRTFVILREGEPAAPDLTLEPGGNTDGLTTLSPTLARQFDELRRISAAGVPVLVHGPTGAGKERVAQAVHLASRRKGAFVPVNCGALPAGLVESELFGHKRGAFSGAVAEQPGLVVASDKGTLFLDEIGDLPAPAQAALLRVLQEHEVRAVGATTTTPVDLRVVAASHRDLLALVDDDKFREDLLARLAGFELTLPPLAARRVDLGVMLSEIAPPGMTLSAGAARALLAYAWPRNVRELVHVIERAVALAGGEEVASSHLPDEVARATWTSAPTAPAASLGVASASSGGAATPDADDGPEAGDRRAQLDELLTKHKGNISQVAAELGRVRQQVQRWIKRYGLDPERYRG